MKLNEVKDVKGIWRGRGAPGRCSPSSPAAPREGDADHGAKMCPDEADVMKAEGGSVAPAAGTAPGKAGAAESAPSAMLPVSGVERFAPPVPAPLVPTPIETVPVKGVDTSPPAPTEPLEEPPTWTSTLATSVVADALASTVAVPEPSTPVLTAAEPPV